MNKEIIRLYKNDFEIVDDFLLKNFSSPTHWQDWNNVVSEYYNTEFFYFALTDGKDIIGICPVHKVKKKYNYSLISGPKIFNLPFGGWIFSEKTNFNQSNLNLKKNESIEILSMPLINEFNAGYEGCKVNKFYQTVLINLEKSEEEILNGFSTQKRYKIRKAVKNEVEITDINEIGFDNYYEFYKVTNKRYGLENITKDFFLELINSCKNINIDFLIAKKNNEILGSVVMISDKFYSLYWLGTRIEKAPNNGYFDLLHWEIMKKAKSHNCRYYDFCYLEEDRLFNIYKFKIGYSNNLISIANIIVRPISYRIINKIQKLI